MKNAVRKPAVLVENLLQEARKKRKLQEAAPHGAKQITSSNLAEVVEFMSNQLAEDAHLGDGKPETVFDYYTDEERKSGTISFLWDGTVYSMPQDVFESFKRDVEQAMSGIKIEWVDTTGESW